MTGARLPGLAGYLPERRVPSVEVERRVSPYRPTPGLIGRLNLLIFASASQYMVEPATAHIVAATLEPGGPVVDVKNACNSVLNRIEVADALIAGGR